MWFFFTEPEFSKRLGHYFCSFTDPNHAYLLVIDSFLYSFGSFTLIFVSNFSILLKFMRAKCKSSSTESTNQALAMFEPRGTVMVVTVSVTCLLLTAPTALNIPHNGTVLLAYNPLYRAFMNLTQYLNHSINGVLYIIVRSRFRKELLKIFGRKERSVGLSCSHSVNNMTDLARIK